MDATYSFPAEPAANPALRGGIAEQRSQQRLRRWLERYGPAEVLATAAAVLTVAVADALTGSAVAAAYAATIVEGLVYYGLIFAREVKEQHSGRASPRDALDILRSMVLEFGGAELLDALFVRPFLIGAGYAVAGAAGAFAGKLAADIIFYAPVVTIHVLRARHTTAPVLRSTSTEVPPPP